MSCPAPAGSTLGNRVTAARWLGILRALGHRVIVELPEQSAGKADVFIALHARRSAGAIQEFRDRFPSSPVVLVMTGTDLYRDIRTDEAAQRSLRLADRIVVLQPKGAEELPSDLRDRVRVILQSAVRSRSRVRPSKRTFDLCVIGHLREEKDPFRALEAAQLLPEESKIRVLHAGQALDEAMGRRARAAASNRYRWLGELPRWKARGLIVRSRALVLSSAMEGGANVLSEAIVAGVPVLASRIPGSEGVLGEDYPALFPVGDTSALAALMRRVESDVSFRRLLQRWVRDLAPRFHPSRERAAWKRLLIELDHQRKKGTRS